MFTLLKQAASQSGTAELPWQPASVTKRVKQNLFGHHGAGKAFLYGMALEGVVILAMFTLITLGAVIGVVSTTTGGSVADLAVFVFYVGSSAIVTLTLIGLAGAARHNYADPWKRERAAQRQMVIGALGTLVTALLALEKGSVIAALVVALIGTLFWVREHARKQARSVLDQPVALPYAEAPDIAQPLMPATSPAAGFPALEPDAVPVPAAAELAHLEVDPASTEEGAPPVPDLPEESIDDVLAEIDERMVGCDRPKREFRELIAFNRIEAERAEDGLPTDPLTLHMAMYGPPGTGKTAFAQYTARAYRAMGILEIGHCVETTMADLIGKVVGETAPKTRAKVEEALGGVLFIDEFYTDEGENQATFTPEMVKELIVQMEKHRHDLVVIVAGYEKKVRSMLSLNPGLRDRIPRKMHFESYSSEELQQIFLRFLARSGLDLDLGADEALARTVDRIRDEGRSDPNFANARAMRNLYDDARRAQASRLHALPNRSRADRQLLTSIDLEDAGARYRSNSIAEGPARPSLIVP